MTTLTHVRLIDDYLQLAHDERGQQQLLVRMNSREAALIRLLHTGENIQPVLLDGVSYWQLPVTPDLDLAIAHGITLLHQLRNAIVPADCQTEPQSH